MSDRLDLREVTQTPIPDVPPLNGWENVPIYERRELLTPLGEHTDYYDLFTSSFYSGERRFSPFYPDGLKDSLSTIFVRESVAKALRKAERLLPKQYHLAVVDGYRPAALQHAIFNDYYSRLQRKFPQLSEDQRVKKAQEFAPVLSRSPKKPFPQSTGGSVELVVVKVHEEIEKEIELKDQLLKDDPHNPDWQNIQMLQWWRNHFAGQNTLQIDFDYGQDKAHLNYYEQLEKKRSLSDSEVLQRDNRRLLYHVMTHPNVGFQPNPFKWWNYNFGNQMAAKSDGQGVAFYGAAHFSPVHQAFENMQRAHLNGSLSTFKMLINPQEHSWMVQAAHQMSKGKEEHLT